MKKLFIVILCLTMCLAVLAGCKNTQEPEPKQMLTPESTPVATPPGESFQFSADSEENELSIADRASAYVARQLAQMKEGPAVFYEPLGFTETEITGSELGNPFRIYLFDDNGQFMESETDGYVFPILYNSDIVGIIEVAYLPDSGYDNDFSFTFGKAYGNELNSLRLQHINDDIVIGNLGTRLLFAIVGEEVTVFKHNFGEATVLTEEEVANILASFYARRVNPDYFTFPRFAYSPDGKYLIEGFDGDYENTVSGFPPQRIRIVDADNGSALWETESRYLLYQEPKFCWSPDSRYVSAAYAGRTWIDALVVDTTDMSQHQLPYLTELAPLFPDAVPKDDRADPCIVPQQWINETTIEVDFYWHVKDGYPGDERGRFSGTYLYDIETGELTVTD